jgi:hypothetical protein
MRNVAATAITAAVLSSLGMSGCPDRTVGAADGIAIDKTQKRPAEAKARDGSDKVLMKRVGDAITYTSN